MTSILFLNSPLEKLARGAVRPFRYFLLLISLLHLLLDPRIWLTGKFTEYPRITSSSQLGEFCWWCHLLCFQGQARKYLWLPQERQVE